MTCSPNASRFESPLKSRRASWQEEADPKIHTEMRGTQNIENNLEEEGPSQGTHAPDFKTHYKTIVTKTLTQGHACRSLEGGREFRNKPHGFTVTALPPGRQGRARGRGLSSTRSGGTAEQPHAEEEAGPLPHAVHGP